MYTGIDVQGKECEGRVGLNSNRIVRQQLQLLKS